MTKEEAYEEAKKAYNWANEEMDKLKAEAKKNGTWIDDLDAGRELYADVNKELFNKAQELYARIDE